MNQEYAVAVTSGTREDRAGLDRRIADEHPQAQRLSYLNKLQKTARNRTAHELWLDEAAEVLLYRECVRAAIGEPESEDRVTLYRIPLLSEACRSLLAFVFEAPRGFLEESRRSLFASSSAVMAMKALLELFAVQLARLRLEHGDAAAIDRIAVQQIAQARTPHELARRRAFRDWHIRQVCATPVGPTPADAARALRLDPQHPPDDLVAVLGALQAYREDAAYSATPVGREGSTRGYLHHYYEFGTVGRQLTEPQRLKLHKTVKQAVIGQDRMVVDIQIDTRADSYCGLPWEPEEIFAEYFDAALHYDQAGSRELWFRLPGSLADQTLPYDNGLNPKVITNGDDVLVTFWHHEEDAELTYLHTDPRPWLTNLMPIHAALLAGDIRPLCLAWKSKPRSGRQRTTAQPTVPPGMNVSTPALKAMKWFLTWSAI